MDFCEVHPHRHQECHVAVEHEALVAVGRTHRDRNGTLPPSSGSAVPG